MAIESSHKRSSLSTQMRRSIRAPSLSSAVRRYHPCRPLHRFASSRNISALSHPIMTTTSSTSSSSSLLCPCANVRRTCAALIHDDDDWTKGGPRGVRINNDALSKLATQILVQQQQNKQKEQATSCELDDDHAKNSKNNDNNNISNQNNNNNNHDDEILLTTWDEHEWHYTGKNYRGGNEQDRRERVALSILAIDAMNFCFWPLSESTTGTDVAVQQHRLNQNRIEYEHLAKTLNYMAQRDDDDHHHVMPASSTNRNDTDDGGSNTLIPTASPNFAFSPQKLASMTVEEMTSELQEAWKAMVEEHAAITTATITPPTAATAPTATYPATFLLQNMSERCRLWNELGTVLRTHFQGSATLFLQQGLTSTHGCHNKCGSEGNSTIRACSLVQWLIQHCSGYRDEAVDDVRGRWICFYKRAQICVADLHGALDLTTFQSSTSTSAQQQQNHQNDNGSTKNMKLLDALTTFADYRVPQYLRHVHVLEYSPSLAACIDQGHELSLYKDAETGSSGRMQELYIRAATVVVAQRLVQECRQKMREATDTIGAQALNAATTGQEESDPAAFHLNDVLVDWYLWQLGEGMLSEMKPHHRVRTIYY